MVPWTYYLGLQLMTDLQEKGRLATPKTARDRFELEQATARHPRAAAAVLGVQFLR